MNYRKKIKSVFNLASAEEISAGMLWYKNANEFALELSRQYKYPVENICGIISALSPACSWDINKRQAENLIKAYMDGLNPDDVSLSTYKNQVNKAKAILKCDDNCLAIELLLGKQARKTRAFFNTILEPDNPCHDVVIDRWIIRAIGMDGLHGSSLLAVYSRIAEAITAEAKLVGILPCQYQAICWLTVQRLAEGIEEDEVPF